MKLDRLGIDQLPGISEGFALDGLDPSVNLVTGPNTIGKSSLVRALKFLLRGYVKDDPPVSLAAEFSDGDSRWRVVRTGTSTQWSLDGQPAARPALPGAEELGRHCMSMEDLLAASGADQALARELRRELRGGFDLGAVRRSVGQRHGGGEAKAWLDAKNRLRGVETTTESLSAREDELPQLDAEIRAAGAAEEQCRKIERADKLRNVITERESLRAALAKFPADMDKLAGREGEDLDKLQERIGKLRDGKREATTQRDQAKEQIDQLGFSGKNLDEAEQALSIAEDKLAALDSRYGELERLREEETGQQTRLEDAAKELGGNGPPQLNSEALTNAEELAAELVQLRTTKGELETKIQIAGTTPDEQELKRHEKAVEALREWLANQAGANATGSARGMMPALIGAAVLAAAGGFALAGGLAAVGAMLAHPLVGGGILLLGAPLFVFIWWRLRHTANPKQPFARERFDSTGLDPPAAWRKEEVAERLRALDEAVGDLLAAQSRASGAEALRVDLENTIRKLAKAERKRAEFAESCGIDPAMPITEYERFIRLSRDWDRERGGLRESRGKIKAVEKKLDADSATLVKILAPWVDAAQSDLDSLKYSVKSFKTRLGQAQKRAEEFRQAELNLASVGNQLADREQDVEALYARVGLEAEEEQQLRDRLERLPSWKESRRELNDCDSREAQFRRELEDAPDLCKLAEAQNAAELNRQLGDYRSIVEQRDSLIEKREQIRRDIQHAEVGGSVAKAIAERTAALVTLENKRSELLDSLATNLLLTQVETAYSAEHEPEVLREAGRLFRQITAHEFELKLGEGGSFQAHDLKQKADRELRELSTGTRMQLLLAVRAAWVDRHKSLPLFLDEALTTSDEERTAEVVRSLHTLADEGGVQVVYFSARRNEAALWRSVLGEDLCVIDLGEARGRAASDADATFTLESRPPLPEPADTPEEYARALAVPPIDPRREAGEIHPFHVLRDDLDLLHRLLRDFRCESLGQLESMLKQQTLEANSDDGAWQPHLLTRCETARAWLDIWRQGRGKLIGRNELESSGAFSGAFLDRATKLLESSTVAGDPKRFLDRLCSGALRNFRHHKREDFETWLREETHLDDRPILSPKDRRMHILHQYEISDPAAAADINRCIDWLEAGLASTHGDSNG